MTEIEQAWDVVDAVARFGQRARRVVALHAPGAPMRERASFRIDTESGMTIKARRMENEAAAQRQQELRADLPADFAPVLARVGAILLESWIEGRPLNEIPPSETLIRRAGSVLAALHAPRRAAGKSLPFRSDLAGLRNDTLSGLRSLATLGALDAAAADLLCAIADAAAPGESWHCLIHTDFCGENMVVDSAGCLFVVDNEHFRFGPPGMDLARSWYRWGWHDQDRSPREWETFREAYEAAGGDAEAFAHEPFWRIAAVTISARLRLRLGHPDTALPLHCLMDIARSTRSGGNR